MRSRKRKLSTLMPKIQRKTPLTNAWYPTHLLILIELALFVQPDFCVLPCRPSPKQSWVVVAEPCRVYVFSVINVSAPVNFLYLLAASIVPYLDLVLCRVTTCQDLAVLEVQRVPWNMRPQKVLYALPFPHVPKMHHWVPTSAHKHMIVNELYAKYSIVMARVVPLSRFACYSQTFCFLFKFQEYLHRKFLCCSLYHP